MALDSIINDDLPESRMEAVLVEEAERAVADVPGLLAAPKPQARLIPGFGEFGLEFTLACHVARFVDQYPVQDELRKRILRRFRAEGIAFPSRVLVVRSDGVLRDQRETRPNDA
jgi:small-conductance mechanosensitive channel